MDTVVAKAPIKLDYIDALRGWAVIGVVAVHVAQKRPDLPWPLGNWMLAGGLGVPLFFMVSAFTLMLSWRDRNDGALPFYIRRLFRMLLSSG